MKKLGPQTDDGPGGSLPGRCSFPSLLGLMLAIILLAGCAGETAAVLTPTIPAAPPVLLVVTNARLEIKVENRAAAAAALRQVEQFGATLAGTELIENGGAIRAEVRTPPEKLGEVMAWLSTSLGSPTYRIVWAQDVTRQYRLLHEQMAETQAKVAASRGVQRDAAQADLAEIQFKMAIRLEKASYDSIMVVLRED